MCRQARPDGEQRNQRGAPTLQKDVDHEDHQGDRDHEGLNDLLHAFGDRACLVKRDHRIHVLWKALLHLGHQLLTPAAASTAFEPGNWYTAMMALGFPFNRLTRL